MLGHMNTRYIQILLLALLFLVGCDRNAKSGNPASVETGLAKEKRRWSAEGWSFLETVGTASTDGQYLIHMSSPTARNLTAHASSSGVRTNKVYVQTNALFLIVTMGQSSGDTFALVFTKPK